MTLLWLAGVALGFPLLNEVEFGPLCSPIPQGADRWWAEGEPGHEMARVTVDLVAHPRAMCNDGTAATYYVRPGVDPTRWVVHLQGGGACQSEEECRARWCYTPASEYSAEMMSSDESFGTLLTGGIFDPDPVLNKFSAWNHVFVHYCSSDFFLGRSADVDFENLLEPEFNYRIHFLGQDTLDAIFTDLRSTTPDLAAQGMSSLDDATQVLLTGTTSGAVGVIHNLDRVSAQLQATNPSVDVRGVIDSAGYPAADTTGGGPYTGVVDPLNLWKYELLAADNSLFGGELDASCIASEIALTEPWWCEEQMHVLTHQVETPFFLYNDQLAVGNPLCKGDPSCVPMWIDQVNALAHIADPDVVGRLSPPAYPIDAPLPGYSLPRCGTHAGLGWPDSLGFLHVKVPLDAYVPGGSTWVSFHDALWSWVEGDSGATTILRSIDDGAPDCPAPPPSAGVGLVATADPDSETVTLTWPQTPYAVNETVYYADGGAPVSTASPSAPPTATLTWVDAGPFFADRRCYAFNGENGEGVGPLSAPVCTDLAWVVSVVPDRGGTDPAPGSDADGLADKGCGCANARPSGAFVAVLASLLFLRRRRIAVIALAGCGSSPTHPPPVEETTPAPETTVSELAPPRNVLLVLADDVGIDRLALYDNPVSRPWPSPPTPTIDALAAAGLTFTTAYASSSCSPTRAMLLTSLYPRDTGIGYPYCAAIQPANALGFEHVMIPEFLNAHTTGYASLVLGKWHLASGESYADNAMAHGFDGHRGTVCTFTEPALGGAEQSWYQWEKNTDGVLSWETTYATIDTTDDAIEALQTLPEPWFILLSYNSAHAPWVAPPDELYTLPTVVDGESTWLETFDTMIEAMDTELGRVIAELDRTDLADRTTVVFTSDNGTPHPVASDAWLSVGGKFTNYESGVRVPLIVRSPLIAAEAHGTRTEAMASLADIFPTVAELAGVPDWDTFGLPLRGRSLLPFLLDPGAPDDRSHLYSEGFQPTGPGPYSEYMRGIRDERYKLMIDEAAAGTAVAFFDLYADGNALGWEGADLLAGDADGIPDDPAAAEAFIALNGTLASAYGIERTGMGIVPK